MGGVNSVYEGCFGDSSDSDSLPTSQDTIDTRRNSDAQDQKIPATTKCQLHVKAKLKKAKSVEYMVKRSRIIASGSVMSRR